VQAAGRAKDGSIVVFIRAQRFPTPAEGTLEAVQVRKRHFLSHLYIKMMILPRQARDKHRENSKKTTVFLQITGAEHALLRVTHFLY
jgi:hypothetical protein